MSALDIWMNVTYAEQWYKVGRQRGLLKYEDGHGFKSYSKNSVRV